MSEKTTYLLELTDGSRRKITVPSSWKVTFGPAYIAKNLRVGPNNGQSTGTIPMALRFYESEKVQKAIFTNVLNFRDMSIEIEDEIVSTSEKDGYMECDGVRKRTTFQATTKEWVNPDIQKEEIPQLPSDTEVFGENV